MPYSDETRLRHVWLRGPFSPVQANLDGMLCDPISPHAEIPQELRDQQNDLYRASPI